MHARPVLIFAVRGLALGTLAGLAACGGMPSGKREHACMTRVMYFESNRSSAEGMLAVGTVVMNRVNDQRYPHSICGVVGQPNQFASGVLSKKMTDSGAVLASQVADQVMRGERHPGVQNAMHFHTAGLRFPYNNMHYVLMAGGNEFYEKY
jgi:spore germination cell wall hydrolase CwlJ-like protein